MSQDIKSPIHMCPAPVAPPLTLLSLPRKAGNAKEPMGQGGRKGWGECGGARGEAVGGVEIVFLCPNTKVQFLHFSGTNRTVALVIICRADFRLSCFMFYSVSTRYIFFLSEMLRYSLRSLQWGRWGPVATWPMVQWETGNTSPSHPKH